MRFKIGDIVVLISAMLGYYKYRGEHATIKDFNNLHNLYEIQIHSDGMILFVSESDIVIASNMTSNSSSQSLISKNKSIEIDGKKYTEDELRIIIKKARCYDGDYC